MKTYHLPILFAFVCYTALLSAQAPLSDGLVACYPLDNNANDVSGNCLHGTVYGATRDIDRDGVYSRSFFFDGIDDYIEIPHSELFNFANDQDFAISLWIKISSGQTDLDTTDNDIISKWVTEDDLMIHGLTGYPYTLRVINKNDRRTGYLYWAQYDGYTGGCRKAVDPHVNGIEKDKFVHVCLNVRSRVFEFYVNGILENIELSKVSCDTENTAPLRFAKRGGRKHANYFRGHMDDVAIWNRKLTAEEIEILAKPSFSIKDYLSDHATMQEVYYNKTYFDVNVFTLDSQQEQLVFDLIDQINTLKSPIIELTGHTNSKCEDDFCYDLSLKRAEVIADYLEENVEQCLDIRIIPMGKKQPESKIDAHNQRVEIRLFELDY